MLSQVCAHDVDELGGAFVALRLSQAVIGHMQQDVILDQLGHQTVDGTAHAGDQLQHVGAAFLVLQGPLDGLYATTVAL